jgi:hypothetical protein
MCHGVAPSQAQLSMSHDTCWGSHNPELFDFIYLFIADGAQARNFKRVFMERKSKRLPKKGKKYSMQRVEKRRACKERGYSFNTKCKGSRHMKDSSNAVNTQHSKKKNSTPANGEQSPFL